MNTYRVVLEYWNPNEKGDLFEVRYINSRSSCGKIADKLLSQDRQDLIRSVDVVPA